MDTTDKTYLLNRMNSTALAVGLGDMIAENTADVATLEASAAEKICVSTVVEYTDLSDGVDYETDVVIPDNAILLRTYYDVITTFVGDGDDSSTLEIGLQSSGDVVAAAAIKTGTAFDAGLHEGIQTGTMSNAIKMTAARTLTMQANIASTDTELTAGKVKIFAEYKLSE